MAASLPLKVGGSSASVYESTLATLEQKDHFLPKNLKDVKMHCGVWFCLYPKLEAHAPATKLSHALQVNKRAVSSCPKVLFGEGFSVAAERAGKSVEANAELQFKPERLKLEIFTPANFSNENYFNGMAMPLNNAIRAADPANNIARSIRPMLFQENANVTRPDDIKCMTVTTAIIRGTKNTAFTQSFELPQDSAAIHSRTEIRVTPVCTYTGPDLMQMTYQQFYDAIVEPLGYDTLCSIWPPGIGEVHAQLLNEDAYEKLCRRIWKADSNVLWDKLHTLVCPTAVLDPTIAVRQCKQVIYDASGQMIIVPLKEFHASFMRCCQMLYENRRPVICYKYGIPRWKFSPCPPPEGRGEVSRSYSASNYL